MSTKNKKINKNILFVLLIFGATIFMGIGYASINGVLLNIDGKASVISQNSLHITSVRYISDQDADLENSSINDYIATTLNSSITLGNSETSIITYEVTIFNTTSDNYIFSGTSYSAPDFYDNSNITFDLTGLTVLDEIASNTSKTFYITFKYVGNDTTFKTLNSYISFDFYKYYTITYQHIDTTNQNYPTTINDNETTKTITFNNDVPADVYITPTVSYTYSNGVLTLNNVKDNITIDRYYSITYNTTGTNPAAQPTKYLHGSVVTFLTPTDGNKTFLGWYRDISYTGNPITDTSGLNENLVLYAKWSSGSYETATTFITNLTNNAPTNTSNIITVPSEDNTCTNTFAYDLTTNHNNLRYVGANPCNYVKFNCNSSGTCELWRIIGVMHGIDSNPVLKLVKNDKETAAAWDTNKKNTWDSSSLYNTLNTTYKNNFNANVISDYVLSAQWYIGGVATTATASTAYNSEITVQSSASSIGIISVSDYAFATSGTSDTTRNTCISNSLSGNSIDTTCYNNNYIYISNDFQWTINKRSNGNNQAIRITDVGKIVNTQTQTAYSYRPCVYLKSSIKINTAVGNGSSSSPYELSSS